MRLLRADCRLSNAGVRAKTADLRRSDSPISNFYSEAARLQQNLSNLRGLLACPLRHQSTVVQAQHDRFCAATTPKEYLRRRVHIIIYFEPLGRRLVRLDWVPELTPALLFFFFFSFPFFNVLFRFFL